MISGVLIAAAFVGTIVFALLLIFRRDLVGVDLAARSLLRLYLYLASLVAVIVFAIGVAGVLDWGMASAFGGEAVYGRPPLEMVCPAAEKCPDPEQLRLQYLHERQQSQDRDLIRGLTLTFFGATFWGAHVLGRRAAAGPDERTSALRRAYFVLGTFVFGLGTVVFLPVGVYQALSAALLRHAPDVFRPGVGDSLSGGLVALPIWLLYLRAVVGGVRREMGSAAGPVPARG